MSKEILKKMKKVLAFWKTMWYHKQCTAKIIWCKFKK